LGDSGKTDPLKFLRQSGGSPIRELAKGLAWLIGCLLVGLGIGMTAFALNFVVWLPLVLCAEPFDQGRGRIAARQSAVTKARVRLVLCVELR